MSKLATVFATIALVVSLGAVAAVVAQQPDGQPRAAVGTGFTYQGRVVIDGVPAEGECALHFGLWDAVSSGTLLAAIDHPLTSVAGGYFNVPLDFGNAFATGQQRFIEVSAQCPAGVGNYVLLGRQELTATPFAQWANNAGSAAQVPWSGITGVPAGVGEPSPYERVVVVAKSGGDFTSIQAALNSITDASFSKRYLVWVAPGIYEERVTMKANVNIHGAGRETTVIRATGGATPATAATVTGADGWLRHLSIENVGGAQPWSVALFGPDGAYPQTEDVTFWAREATNNTGVWSEEYVLGRQVLIVAQNGTATGLRCQGCIFDLQESEIILHSSPTATGMSLPSVNLFTMRDVRISVTGTGSTTGMDIGNMVGTGYDVRIRASGTGTATGTTRGIFVSQGNFELTDSQVEATNGSVAIGVEHSAGALTLTNTTIVASNAGSQNEGVRHRAGAEPQIVRSTVRAFGPSSRALTNVSGDSVAAIVRVTGSVLEGGTFSVAAFSNNITYRIGSSQLIGSKGGLGTYKCIASYDANFNALPGTC